MSFEAAAFSVVTGLLSVPVTAGRVFVSDAALRPYCEVMPMAAARATAAASILRGDADGRSQSDGCCYSKADIVFHFVLLLCQERTKNYKTASSMVLHISMSVRGFHF